jgi:hypothetical protein
MTYSPLGCHFQHIKPPPQAAPLSLVGEARLSRPPPQAQRLELGRALLQGFAIGDADPALGLYDRRRVVKDYRYNNLLLRITGSDAPAG